MQLLFALLHRTKEDFFSLLFHIITLFSEALHLKLFFKIFIVLVVVCFLYRPAASILLPSQCVTASSPQSPASRSASLCSRSSLREISDSGDWRQATGDPDWPSVTFDPPGLPPRLLPPHTSSSFLLSPPTPPPLNIISLLSFFSHLPLWLQFSLHLYLPPSFFRPSRPQSGAQSVSLAGCLCPAANSLLWFLP